MGLEAECVFSSLACGVPMAELYEGVLMEESRGDGGKRILGVTAFDSALCRRRISLCLRL